jgi:fumarate hydratase subunit beta
MDAYTPLLLGKGLKGMIGKGCRSAEVIKAIKKHKAVYFSAFGGLGALLSKHIVKSEVVAYQKLGAEAIRKLELEGFPAIVTCDSRGRDLYSEVRDSKQYIQTPASF